MAKKPMHPDLDRAPGLKKLIEDDDRERVKGIRDKTKTLHRFHDPDVSDDPIETRNSKWAMGYIHDHSMNGNEPLNHEMVHPSGKTEWQSYKPGEIAAARGKFAFKQ